MPSPLFGYVRGALLPDTPLFRFLIWMAESDEPRTAAEITERIESTPELKRISDMLEAIELTFPEDERLTSPNWRLQK